MIDWRALSRHAAKFVAQTLAGLGTGALLEVATWRALLMGLAANVVPAVVHLLNVYAQTGTVPEPECDQ